MSIALREFMATQDIEVDEVVSFEELYQDAIQYEISFESIDWATVGKVAVSVAVIGAAVYLLARQIKKVRKDVEKKNKAIQVGGKQVRDELLAFFNIADSQTGYNPDQALPAGEEIVSTEKLSLAVKDYFIKSKIFLTNPLIFSGVYSPDKLGMALVKDDAMWFYEYLVPKTIRVLDKQLEIAVDWITAHPTEEWDGQLDTSPMGRTVWKTFGLKSTLDNYAERLRANQDPLSSQNGHKTSMVIQAVIDNTTKLSAAQKVALGSIEHFADDISKTSHRLDRQYVIRTGEDGMAVVRRNISHAVDIVTRYAEWIAKLCIETNRRQNTLLLRGFKGIEEGQKQFIGEVLPDFNNPSQIKRIDSVLKHHEKVKQIVVKLERIIGSGG